MRLFICCFYLCISLVNKILYNYHIPILYGSLPLFVILFVLPKTQYSLPISLQCNILHTDHTFPNKVINNLVGRSRTSSWVLVGPHGHHTLRPPTPIPSEGPRTFNALPPIYHQDGNSHYDWALKSKKVTLSALLQV